MSSLASLSTKSTIAVQNPPPHLDHGLLEVVDVVLDGGGRAADVPALGLATGPGGSLPWLADLIPGLGI